MAMISLLVRNDYLLPARVVSILVKNLIHDNIFVRKGALHLLGTVLKQQKRPHPKVTLDIPNRPTPGTVFQMTSSVHIIFYMYKCFSFLICIVLIKEKTPKLN
jgi:hypothetical protein